MPSAQLPPRLPAVCKPCFCLELLLPHVQEEAKPDGQMPWTLARQDCLWHTALVPSKKDWAVLTYKAETTLTIGLQVSGLSHASSSRPTQHPSPHRQVDPPNRGCMGLGDGACCAGSGLWAVPLAGV